MVFVAVFAITTFAGIAIFTAAYLWADPTETQRRAIDAMDYAWKGGLAVMFSMIGARSLS